MKYLVITLLIMSTPTFARTYHCEFVDSLQKSGTLSITISGRRASIDLRAPSKRVRDNKCSMKKEEYGTLIECSRSEDIMILLNQSRQTTGGIMSDSLNLFVDIEC